MKQDYNITTPNNEKITTVPGKKGPDDMIILTQFPKMPWPHSLYYIGCCLRLKGMVEERAYPQKDGYQGRDYLLDYVAECILSLDVPISDLCKKYKIPEKEVEQC